MSNKIASLKLNTVQMNTTTRFVCLL